MLTMRNQCKENLRKLMETNGTNAQNDTFLFTVCH